VAKHEHKDVSRFPKVTDGFEGDFKNGYNAMIKKSIKDVVTRMVEIKFKP
jgi:hypothetical protein